MKLWWGVYWFHHGCLSVRLSVEKCFLHNNYFCFWPTMMILYTCVDHDPRRTSFDFGVKSSKVKFGLQTFLHFPHDDSFSFWPAMMILHTCVDLTMTRQGLVLILGSKVKGQGHIWTLNFLPFPHDNSISFGYFTHVLTMTRGGPLLILRSIVKRSRSYLDFELFTVSAR